MCRGFCTSVHSLLMVLSLHMIVYASQEPVKYYNCEFHTDTNYIETVYVILYLQSTSTNIKGVFQFYIILVHRGSPQQEVGRRDVQTVESHNLQDWHQFL